MKKLLLFALLTSFTLIKVSAQTLYSKNDLHHSGETITISAKVYGGKILSKDNRSLLDLGGNAPYQSMTIMIPGEDMKKFKGYPHMHYKGKRVKVTGKLVLYRGKPQIVVNDPSQVQELLSDNTGRHRAD